MLVKTTHCLVQKLQAESTKQVIPENINKACGEVSRSNRGKHEPRSTVQSHCSTVCQMAHLSVQN